MATANFLKRRCPQLMGVTLEKELPKSVQLPSETVITMLQCLQVYISVVSPELSETIKTMIANHGPLVKPRPAPPGVGMSLKRQGSLDSPLPPSALGGQVSQLIHECVASLEVGTVDGFFCLISPEAKGPKIGFRTMIRSEKV